jgi:hypothetical protein
MIISKLAGGLGNQMFEYACGKALSEKFNVPLMLDHSFLEDKSPREDFTYRDYELNAFGINKKIETSELKKLGLHEAAFKPYKTLLSLKRLFAGYDYFIQKGFGIDNRISGLSPKAYLVGYFQNEFYFKEYADIIRKDFSFIETQSEENRSLIKQISNTENAVALHVRRGDYLTLGNGIIHGTCTIDYYKNAMQIIKSKIANPTFFIFSADDPQWPQQYLNPDVPFEVIGNNNTGSYGYENMRLMSLCKHNIIANSSFSWWGAWLNKNPDKIVIAPQQWFADSFRNGQTKQITPNNWLRI